MTEKVVAWPRVMEPPSVLAPLTLSTASALDESSVMALVRVIPPESWSEPASLTVTVPVLRAPPVSASTVPSLIVVLP